MAEIVKLGSFCVNGCPVPPDQFIASHDTIGFGDTDRDNPISFVEWEGILVAIHCICRHISWEELSQFGFVSGWPIKIDGNYFLCRMPDMTVAPPKLGDEWDRILDDLGEDNKLWNWENRFFWGQNKTPGDYPGWAPVRGFHSARTAGSAEARHIRTDIGFRPILEPLPSSLPLSKTALGLRLRVYLEFETATTIGSRLKALSVPKTPSGASTGRELIEGRLIGFSDYDIILDAERPVMVPLDCTWARQEGRSLIIDRAAIAWMRLL